MNSAIGCRVVCVVFEMTYGCLLAFFFPPCHPRPMKKGSLLDRMYFDPVYTAVVRMIGYSGLSKPEAYKQADELAKQYPKKQIRQAAHELCKFDSDIVQLTAEARKAARGILGVDPDHPLADYWRHGPPDIMGEENMRKWQDEYRKRKAKEEAQEQEQSKKRTRKGRQR